MATATRAASLKYGKATADFTVTFTGQATPNLFVVKNPTTVAWGTNSPSPTVVLGADAADVGAVTYTKKQEEQILQVIQLLIHTQELYQGRHKQELLK